MEIFKDKRDYVEKLDKLPICGIIKRDKKLKEDLSWLKITK